jgi:CSLREA domain-containing protein
MPARRRIGIPTMRLSFVASLLLFFAVDASATTFTVTLLTDPSPDGCLPGDCSLREAIEAAEMNDPGGPGDVVLVPAGTITLSSSRGSLAVAQPVRVQGAGSDVTSIRNAQGGTLFEANQGANLALVGLGLESDFGGSVGASISVYTADGSRVTMDDVLVKEGHVLANSGNVMEIRHSRLLDSLADNGGDVLVEDSTMANVALMTSVSETTLRRVVLDNSLDPEPGPGVYENVYLVAGLLAIEDSTITHSSIYVPSTATLALNRVQYVDNTGPIRTDGAATVTIEDSVFEGNLVRALYAAGDADWTISGSTFVDNRVDGNAGGAIVFEDDTFLHISNSTFSGNSFTVAAAAGGARGGAIGYRNGSGAHLVLTQVTIVPPIASPVGVVGTAIGGLGGGAIIDFSNTIVRGSCAMDAGVLLNNAGNIESPGHGCGFDTTENRVDVDPADLALGVLGAHGGFTPTYLPGEDSVAIDHGSAPQCLPVDQRGWARPGGVRCDVGAVEADADDTLFVDGFEG